MVKASKAVCREYTVHIHKYVFGTQFKKRTPKALRSLKEFARKAMGTKDVRIDTSVNKFLWSRGVKNPPHRIRVRLTRKITEDAEQPHLYTLVEYVSVPTFKGLQTVAVEAENWSSMTRPFPFF